MLATQRTGIARLRALLADRGPLAASAVLALVFVLIAALTLSGGSSEGARAQMTTATWTIQETPTDRALRGVDFVDPLFGWAVGGEGRDDEKDVMMRTTDGGRTWRQLPFPLPLPRDRRLNGVDFVDRNTGWIVGVRGLIMRTDDGGQSWRQQDSGTTNSLRRVHFLDHATGFIAVARQPFILRTDDGGATWKRLSVPENDGLSDIFFLNGETGWGHGGDKVLVHTTDGGESWENQFSGSDRRFYGLHFVDAEYGWISGADIRATADGGQSWTFLLRAGKTIERIHFTDRLTGLGIGDEGMILHTTDGGLNWLREAEDISGLELHDLSVQGPMHAWTVGNNGQVLYRYDPDAIPTSTPTATSTFTPTPTPTPTPTLTPTPAGPWLAAGDPPWPTMLLPLRGTTIVQVRYGNLGAGTPISATLEGAAVFADGGTATSGEITLAGSGLYPLLLRAAPDATPGAPFVLSIRAGDIVFEWPGVIPRQILLPRTDKLWH